MLVLPPLPNDIRPLHERITESLRVMIRTGELPVGSRLPGETELMRHYGTARGTIRRALRTLSEDGLIQTFHGRGSFVLAGHTQHSIAQRYIGLGEALSYSEKDMTTKLLHHEIVSSQTLNNFPITFHDDEKVLFLDRVRSLDDVPVARLKNWVRIEYAPGIEKTDFEKVSLFNALDACSQGKVASGRRDFEAVVGDEGIAQSLSVSTSSPLLFLQQVTYLEDSTPIETSHVWMDSSQVKVSVMLTR